ncbi:MAG: hypothetical protein KGL39_34690 [Patescibacteria group bacterium]|nr:hypothetical protein [Patescibacteria group bacterium]
MGRASNTQHAFNSGEFSPLLYGRQDLEQYDKALATCFNALPLAQGAWTRRPGTLFLGATKYSGQKKARLLPFQYSATQSYILEFGYQYIRFWNNDTTPVTLASQSVTGVTQANPAVLTYTGSDPANGTRFIISGVVGMTQLNGVEVVVTGVNTGSKTFQLYDVFGNAINSTGYDAYSSGGTIATPFEVTTAFQEADLEAIRITQSADTLYILHPNYAPQTLVRLTASPATFSISTPALLDGPYDNMNSTSTTLTASATTGSVTVTASAITGINNGAGFQATDVGRLIRMQVTSNWGWLKITAVTSTTVVTASIMGGTIDGTTATANWRLGWWSNTTGWPTCAVFYQDRLCMGGAAVYPQGVACSVTSDYLNFAPTATNGTVVDSNAVNFTMASNQVNSLMWLMNDIQGLLAGTAYSEWVIAPASSQQALSPTNSFASQQSTYGSVSIQPVKVGRQTLFFQRGARKLREMTWNWMLNGFQSPDISLLSEHITKPAIVEMGYQNLLQPILWMTRSDGGIVGCTYMRDNQVLGWHEHALGGFSDSGKTTAAVAESVAIITSSDGTVDVPYFVVQRYINGKSVRCVEALTKTWEKGNALSTAYFADCGTLITNGSPSTAISGINWLEGETVPVLADGALHPDVTITNGKATLNYAATNVVLGYSYNSDGENLPFEGGARDGSAQGKLKKIPRVGFWLHDTLGLQYGPSFTSLTYFVDRVWGATNYGQPPALFNGVKRESFPGDFDRDSRVCWRANTLFPATVLAIMPQGDVEDDS